MVLGFSFSLKVYEMDRNPRPKFDGHWYYWLLRNTVIPELKRRNPVNPGTLDRMWFQQAIIVSKILFK